MAARPDPPASTTLVAMSSQTVEGHVAPGCEPVAAEFGRKLTERG